MAGDRRSETEIRREIAAEREQLTVAIAELRSAVGDRRRVAAAAGSALATGLAAAALVRFLVRRRRG